jgi:hypothetical protein
MALRFNLISDRKQIISSSKQKNKFWQGCEESGKFTHDWWECKLGYRNQYGISSKILK